MTRSVRSELLMAHQQPRFQSGRRPNTLAECRWGGQAQSIEPAGTPAPTRP
jgi:hypothetical protein